MCKIDWISQYNMTRGSVTGGYIMKKTFKKLTALATVVALAATIFVANPISVQARSWIDGDTPEKFENRVKSSFGVIYRPTVRTNFHASSMKALLPSTPEHLIDIETGVNVSQYDDAFSCVFVDDNTEYGELADVALDNALAAINGGTYVSIVTINLMKYEGKAYKLVPNTLNDIEFKVAIPKSVYESYRSYAMVRLNPDGTVSYLTDLDNDPATLTFKTNYFGAYNVYGFVYGAAGAFDAYKPVVQPGITPVPVAVPVFPTTVPVVPVQ